jgi:hypothetical protein
LSLTRKWGKREYFAKVSWYGLQFVTYGAELSALFVFGYFKLWILMKKNIKILKY